VKYHPFEGRLVRLRAREVEDAPAFHRWFNDPEITTWLGLRYPVSPAREATMLEQTAPAGYQRAAFSVEALSDGRLVGNCELQCHLENRCGTVGIAFGEREAGFGTDAMRVLCRFGFEMMNLHRIELTVDATNERARHVYRKVGFRDEGVLRERRFIRGEYRGTAWMSLFRDEFQQEDQR
jgi:RimJ/RimL family protein N-acetyltransferase